MRLPRLPLAAATAIALATFAAGWWLGRNDSTRRALGTPPRSPVPDAPAAVASPTPAHASDLNKTSAPEPAATALAPSPASPRRSVSPALLKLLGDRRNRFYVNPLTDDETRLSPEILALLEISPEEQQQAESDLAATREAIHQLSRANFKVVSQNQDSAEISLAPLPEGAALKKNLADNFARILGEDRAQVIFTRMDDTSFMGFGADQQTIKIEWKGDMVHLTHQFKDKKGNNRTSRGWSSPELPKLYEDILTRR